MNIDFKKCPNGLVPTIIQDASTQKVLMLGFMNEESFHLTRRSGRVTFYSRSRSELWIKGETSGGFLEVVDILIDCDSDTLLVKAVPAKSVCHTGADTCFGEKNENGSFLFDLARIIKDRKTNPAETSYTSSLFVAGLDRIAQKVGEEAIELIIEAKGDNDERFRSEAADLLYHLLVLFAQKNIELDDVIRTLGERAPKCHIGDTPQILKVDLNVEHKTCDRPDWLSRQANGRQDDDLVLKNAPVLKKFFLIKGGPGC